MKDIAEKSLFIIPEKIKRLLWSFIILGIGMFIAGLMTGGKDSELRIWQAFLINTVFLGRYCSCWDLFQCYLATD